MAVPHQRWVVAGIWTVFLAGAVNQGLTLPEFVRDFPAKSAWAPVVFAFVAPPVLLALNFVFARGRLSRPYDPGFIGRWADRRWGQGSAFEFLQALRFPLLFGCGVFVLGMIGLLTCFSTNAGAGGYSISLFFLVGGTWFVVIALLMRRWLPQQPW
jgi:hypothetical protein